MLSVDYISSLVPGRPSPVVTWLKGGSVVSADYEELNNGSVRRVSSISSQHSHLSPVVF